MKSKLLFCIVLMATTAAQAQRPSPEVSKKEMSKLAYLAGKWTGSATMNQPDGTVSKIDMEEQIQYKLDKTLLLIEGIGRNPEDAKEIIFNALAIVTYSQQTKSFGFKSHLMDGNQTEAYFHILADNHFEWGFDIPSGGKIRYTLILNPQAKTWAEKGEYSADGNTWRPFLEMNLKKVSD